MDEKAKYEVVPFPEPEEAATEHSPNRKPRYKRAMRLWSLRQAMRLWLQVYRLTGDVELAGERVARPAGTVMRWYYNYPEFHAEYDHIKKMWADVVDGTLQSLDIRAVQAVKVALEQTADGRLRTETAVRILRAHGFLPDRVEHVGADGGAIQVIHTVEVVGPKEG